jgi:hypothetical protein
MLRLPGERLSRVETAMQRKMGDVIEKVCLIGMLVMVAAGALVLGVNANEGVPPHCAACPNICDFVVKAAGPFLWFATVCQALLLARQNYRHGV